MDAKDILSGRKVDAEKGCILKAEMAKKNLHTKRGLSSDIFATTAAPATPAPPTIFRRATMGSSNPPPSILLGRQREFSESYLLNSPPPIPRDILNPPDYPGFDVPNEFMPLSRASSIASFQDYIEKFNNTFHPENLSFSRPASPSFGQSQDRFTSNEVSDSFFMKDSQLERGFNSALFSTDDFTHLPSTSAPATTQNSAAVPSKTEPATTGATSLISALSTLQVNPNALLSTPVAHPAHRGTVDQNPPCNTLYVGNLPPNSQVEELEQLFSKTRGYKRLCFRNRPNGPMCFVEFEDIQCAALAMHDLYGTPLSTHTKGGGIRLSFSKNPLGVRQQQPFSGPGSSNGSSTTLQNNEDSGLHDFYDRLTASHLHGDPNDFIGSSFMSQQQNTYAAHSTPVSPLANSNHPNTVTTNFASNNNFASSTHSPSAGNIPTFSSAPSTPVARHMPHPSLSGSSVLV